MTVQVSKRKNISRVLTVAITLTVIIAIVLGSCFTQPYFKVNLDSIVPISPIKTSPPICLTGINEANIKNATDSVHNYSSAPLNTAHISLHSPNLTMDNPPDQSQLFSSFLDNIGSIQAAESAAALRAYQVQTSIINTDEPNSLNVANPFNSDSSLPLNSSLISLNIANFTTYTYGGYPVQSPDPTTFCFSFPDQTNQGQIAGSDAITSNTYSIQQVDFDATFTTPKIGALGFDEMVIFATSNTFTYKGTEFGIRMSLMDGLVCGYIQEPTGIPGEVDFQTLNLMPNDGITHHYTLIVGDSQVSFYIDGINYGYLNFGSNNDLSNTAFSLCAVVHRFSDNWDSNGDNMTVENFSIN